MMIVPGDRGGDLRFEEIPEPTPGPHEVLIDVRAGSVNRADLAQRDGTHGPGPDAGPIVAGLDAAGQVIAVGSEVERPVVGERVMAMAAGGLAERIVVDAEMAVPLPNAWSYVQGAAAIVGLMTEHDALVTVGSLRVGESVVIHGAASGVGLQGVQIASRLGAGRVIATVRGRRSEQLLYALGATAVVDATEGGLAEALLAAGDREGVDLVIDHVGGPYLPSTLAAMAVRGRLVGVGRLGGTLGKLDMEALALKRLALIGVTFRTRSLEEKGAVVAAMRRDLGDALERGELDPTIASVEDWSQAPVAQERMAMNAHLGKMVLTVG